MQLPHVELVVVMVRVVSGASLTSVVAVMTDYLNWQAEVVLKEGNGPTVVRMSLVGL